MQAPVSLRGHLLLALPGIGDPRFERAAMALCAHDEDGALAVGVGEPAGRMRFHDLLGELGVPAAGAPNPPVLLGGPLEPGRGFVLHSTEWEGEGTLHVSDAFALTTTLDVLHAIAAGTGPDRWQACLGYAGWGAGQLDGELAGHGWFNVPATEALLFETAVEDRWRAAYASAGVDVRLLATTGGTA